jgi:hypothetical protein
MGRTGNPPETDKPEQTKMNPTQILACLLGRKEVISQQWSVIRTNQPWAFGLVGLADG